MPVEFELKAHVHEPEELKLLLGKQFTFMGSFEKKDEYWVNSANVCVRLRKEKFTDEKGKIKETNFITWKEKEIQEKIEVNRENEFSVSNIDEFECLISRLKMKKDRKKHKTGYLYQKDEVKAELCEVETLGFFIEIEIIAEDSSPDTVSAAKKRLYECLALLNIDNEAIETRFYSDLLAEKG